MKNKTIKQLVVNAMYIALLVVSSFISIPINHIPYTLQTLIVFIILINVYMKSGIIIKEETTSSAIYIALTTSCFIVLFFIYYYPK